MGATDQETAYVEHPLLTPETIERRLYQLQLVDTATAEHALVSLPTGLGKTSISLLVTARRLDALGGKSLLLAPTKPLVQQHADFYREALALPDEETVVFTGEVRPEERATVWADATVVIATPQVIENDLIGGRIDLQDVVHCTFDECHRATGDYAYTYIAERYHADADAPLATGLSASPGGDTEEILRICENLGLTEVEVMTDADADVAEYTYTTDVEWKRIELPEAVLSIRDALADVIEDRLTQLKELGVVRTTAPDISQTELNKVRGQLQKLIENGRSDGYTGMSIHAEVMKLRRAMELVETQSVESLRRYFERQRNAARSSGASKASQRLVSEPRVREAMRLAEEYDDLHPKFRRTRMLLAETLGIDGGDRVIVFTESRDTAETLTEFLGEHFETRRFVGQGDREGSDGMTQREQQETLDAFRAGEFEVLVSTSVAEEGLDVPEVDLVLFYEPVPTAIRSIQRKGRTGRQTEGRVVVLLAEDTRDEAYFWKAQNEEKRMRKELRQLKGVVEEVREELHDQPQLVDFDDGASNGHGDDGKDDDRDGSEENASDDRKSTTHDAVGSGQAGLEEFGPVVDPGRAINAAETDETVRDGDERNGSEGIVARVSGDTDTADADETAGEDATVEVVIDQRELDSTIARTLSTRDEVSVRLETLSVGDYVLSDRVVVERKSVSDFVDTLVGGDDRSLFEQAGDLARHYARPVLIIEGEGDLYAERNIHPNAVRGALASLAVDFDVSVLHTEDEADTADLLQVIAEREQTTRDREVSVHGEKAAKTLAEQQEYVVSAIADIGPVTARALLEAFDSVEAVMTATEEELKTVEGIGDVTATRIREVVASEYDP